MAWLNTVTLRTVSKSSTAEYLISSFGGLTSYRVVTTTVEECPGVDETTANNYVAANPADGSSILSCYATRMNDAGAYNVVKESRTYGSWTPL